MYEDSLNLPPLPTLLGPPRNLPEPTGVILDEIAIQQEDGSLLVVLEATWSPQGVLNTQVRWRQQGLSDWERVTTMDSRIRLFPVVIGNTYEAQVRHQWGGGHWSAWTPIVSELIDGDLTPPEAAGTLVVTGANQGYQVSWPRVMASDYDATIVEDRLASGGVFNERVRATGTTTVRFGLLGNRDYDVRVRHADKSGNLGGYSPIATVRTLDVVQGADGEEGPPGADGIGLEYVFAATTTANQPPAGSRPLASWTYDQSLAGDIAIGVESYGDGSPSDYGANNPFLHRYSRKVSWFT